MLGIFWNNTPQKGYEFKAFLFDSPYPLWYYPNRRGLHNVKSRLPR